MPQINRPCFVTMLLSERFHSHSSTSLSWVWSLHELHRHPSAPLTKIGSGIIMISFMQARRAKTKAPSVTIGWAELQATWTLIYPNLENVCARMLHSFVSRLIFGKNKFW